MDLKRKHAVIDHVPCRDRRENPLRNPLPENLEKCLFLFNCRDTSFTSYIQVRVSSCFHCFIPVRGLETFSERGPRFFGLISSRKVDPHLVTDASRRGCFCQTSCRLIKLGASWAPPCLHLVTRCITSSKRTLKVLSSSSEDRRSLCPWMFTSMGK